LVINIKSSALFEGT